MYYISIIVPLYHGKKYISKLVTQIENCARLISDRKVELILSNDAPDDHIEDGFSSTLISVKVLNTDINRGIHGARIKGFSVSTGEYVVFLDQDDKIEPEYFVSQLQAIGTADAVICNALSAGKPKYATERPLCKAASRESMITEGCMILSPGQVLIRRSAVPESWIKNVMRRNGADDWLLWLCMHAGDRTFKLNQDILFIREVHYQNTSFDILEMAASEAEVIKIIEENDLLYTEERNKLRELLPKLQEKRIRENEKFKKMFLLQNDWFSASIKGLSAAQYLKGRQIETTAVYGYGYLGRILLGDLKKNGMEVSYVIDRDAEFLDIGVKCCTLEDELEQVDAVVMTLMTSDRDIVCRQLEKKLQVRIYWLEDMIHDMLQ